ncbi:translocase of chloroplast 90, chloroplastic [Quillaja saponaria]|uniref:Translocase of chloroplast 90, chloroplastic n=1 Tax=Quillaja saponaria TaxID=32244 RepID=A0AAD7PJ98_QUISA|nr:translocase of chloroplast 90, chloroplastic [Quillaja saponaria]
MKSVRDWVFSQLVSNSSVSSRPMPGSDNFFHEGPELEESEDQVRSASLIAQAVSSNTSSSSNGNQETQSNPTVQQIPVSDYYQSQYNSKREKDRLAKVEDLQINFFRLIKRLGQSQENLLVAKVLYRIHLATLIRAGESDLKRVNVITDRARAVALEQEATGLPELDFSCRILVLGKTGVGKSATVNSIFDQAKTITDPFRPATNCIQEIVGTVNGVKITVIDTPGLLPSSTTNMRRNRKIMLSVRRFIRKSPPDIVLYFERLDLINAGYCEFPLLKLITEVFGTDIWFNTILVMTHSSSAVPEGPNGNTVNYESYVSRCTNLVQHYIHQAVSDSSLENPVLLVENHPQCKRNARGEKILPNGQVWRSQLLLLCICTKVLCDVNCFLEFQNSMELGPVSSTRLPSLPHLLSSILRHRSVSNPTGTENEIEEILLSDTEEDEYDQLPSFRILTKSKFDKLTKSQKKDYLEELDYREILYLKKQLKEDYRRQQESRLSKEQNLVNNDHPDEQQTFPEAVLLPDMAIPPSFDSDCPLHRYRCLVANDQWLVKPVLDPQGWDHDVGFDGINLETAVEMKKNVFALVTGQMSKDKQDFSIQSESAVAYVDPRGPTYSVGLDVQSSGKDLICTVHSNTKLRNLKHNIADCGISMTSLGKEYYVGAKIEDTISIGKRLRFVINGGRMQGSGQVAYGGSLEATLRGRDYPVINDNVSLAMTVLSYNKEMVFGGSLQSEFRLSRSLKVSVNANLNSRKMGQVCIKTSSSENLQIAFLAVFSVFKFLLRRKGNENMSREAMERG